MTLCRDDKATFNLVIPTYLQIKELMVHQSKDSPAIFILKKRFLKYLDKKFSILEHNVIATFLTPEFRSLPKNYCDPEKFLVGCNHHRGAFGNSS